jgi:hypothetical protein
LRKLLSEWLIEAWSFEGIDYATGRRDA